MKPIIKGLKAIVQFVCKVLCNDAYKYETYSFMKSLKRDEEES